MEYYQNLSKKPNYMEIAALALGIASLATCSCCYISIPAGALAIVLGLLSRGGKMKLSSKAQIGIILAAVGIILTVVFYGISFYLAILEYGSIEGILRESCETLGLDFEALYGDMFP